LEQLGHKETKIKLHEEQNLRKEENMVNGAKLKELMKVIQQLKEDLEGISGQMERNRKECRQKIIMS